MTISLNYKVERNPIINVLVDGVVVDKILYIGDPHIGRRFTTGVPSHRLGDREEFLFSTFKRLLNPTDPLVTKIVIVGDLFDKFIVNPTYVYDTYDVFKQVSDKIEVYLIPGNHDLSKDVTKKSSFQLLTLTVAGLENVHVIEKNEYHTIDYDGSDLHFYFDCYNPFEDCNVEPGLLAKLKSTGPIISTGHWDSLSILDKGYIPTQDLLNLSDIVVSGHEHTYREYEYPFDKQKNKVLFTGSMQPYSHAEDPDSEIYMTIKEADLVKYDAAKSFQYKCLRIECSPLFVLTESIDCFALTHKVVEEIKKETEIETEKVDVNNYNQTLLTWVESKKDITESVKQELSELLKTKGYLS